MDKEKSEKGLEEALASGGLEKVFLSIIEKAKKYDKLVHIHPGGKLHCSFCGKPQDNVNKLIAGPNAYICDECVSLCWEIINEDITSGDAISEE